MKPLALFLASIAIAFGSSAIDSTWASRNYISKKTIKKSVVSGAKHSSAKTLTILYTSSARGQVRSCNCTKFRFGGYGRELTLLKSIREKNQDVLLIEGGDITGETGFQSKLKADVASKALKMLGYNLIVPGEEELGVRGESYIEYFKSSKVPIVCANITDAQSEKPMFRPFIVVKTNSGLKVGIIGLFDGDIGGKMFERTTGCIISDPVLSLKYAIKKIRAKCDIVAVIYHGLACDAKKFAGVPGVDFVMTTHFGDSSVIFPQHGENTINAPIEKDGNTVVVDSKTKSNWCLGCIELNLTPQKKISGVSHKLIYLDRSFNESPEMVKVYDSYNEKVKNAVLSNSIAFKKNTEAILLNRGIDIQAILTKIHKSLYVTSEKCADCHLDAYEKWSKSPHSHAMQTLKNAKQEYDPECVNCHSTGAAARNGFTNIKETPELGNVQCEACHGPGGQHIKSPAKGYGKCGEETCRSCHTDERTPNFDFDSAWEIIKHQ